MDGASNCPVGGLKTSSGPRLAGPEGSSGEEAGAEEQDATSSSLSPLTVQQTSQQQRQGLQDDLEEFRQQWRQEVSQPAAAPAAAPAGSPQQEVAPSPLDKAVGLYMAAMQLEQQGKLYEATQQYRRAVQLEPGVEEAVRRLLVTPHRRHGPRTDGAQESESDSASEAEEAHGEEAHGEETDGEETHRVLTRLQSMTLTGGRFCQPATPQTGHHISRLPAEVLQLILRWVVTADLDIRSLEMFGLVCRGFYQLSRDPAIWKRICHRVLGKDCAETAGVTAAGSLWRELYLSQPHLHFCGCYIGRASYIRAGEPNGYQDSSYRPWQMVHYYRYLRFFPEGVLLMLTSAEEPAASVGQLLQRPPRPGNAVTGHWRLQGDRVVAVLCKPRDTSSRRLRPGRHGGGRAHDKTQYDPGEQRLHIELEVLPVRGDSYQLAWQSYAIVTRYLNGKETSHGLDLNDQFPTLRFSRVRSYTAVSSAALR